jgi:hypothetical protein
VRWREDHGVVTVESSRIHVAALAEDLQQRPVQASRAQCAALGPRYVDSHLSIAESLRNFSCP